MAGMPYRIVDVSNWRILSVEEMGSKPKFWVQDPDGPKWLFKHRHRPSVGDDWAEKIAAEVAEKLAIPHATVELARFEDKPGIISRDLVGTASPRELVLGNSLLVEADPTYPQTNRYHVAEHTIDRVFNVLGAEFIGLPEESPGDPAIRSPLDLFVGYLLLDALIGNTDRHHENWAILQLASSDNQRRAVLCPTFDHASSLAHGLTDEERVKRLNTRDQGYAVPAFLRRARSALYRVEGDPQPMSPIDAFRAATDRRPDSGGFWRGQLKILDAGILEETVLRVPDEIMSEPSKEFTLALLACNRSSLLAETR